MPVLLPNTQLTATVYTHPVERDPHGKPLGGTTTSETRGPYPGATTTPFDGDYSTNQWTLRADERMWPLAPGDVLTTAEGDRFIVRHARLHTVPGFGAADYIRVVADPDPGKTL